MESINIADTILVGGTIIGTLIVVCFVKPFRAFVEFNNRNDLIDDIPKIVREFESSQTRIEEQTGQILNTIAQQQGLYTQISTLLQTVHSDQQELKKQVEMTFDKHNEALAHCLETTEANKQDINDLAETLRALIYQFERAVPEFKCRDDDRRRIEGILDLVKSHPPDLGHPG